MPDITPAVRADLVATGKLRVGINYGNFILAQKDKASGVQYEMYMYPGTQHGFHNNSTPRYHEPSAKLAWERTIAFFKKHLA